MKKIAISILTVALSLTMGLSAFAAYRPSIEQKAAPEVMTEMVEFTDPTTGVTVVQEAAATIEIEGGIAGCIGSGEIAVTPVSSKEEAVSEEVSEALTQASEDLKSGKVLENLTETFSASAADAIKEQAKQLLEDAGFDMTQFAEGDDGAYMEKVVVRDLFDITLTGDMANLMQEDSTIGYAGNAAKVTTKVDAKLDASEPTPVVIFKCDGSDTWETIPAEYVKRNADGSLAITFERFCVVAFLTADPTMETESDVVTSPETGVTKTAQGGSGVVLFAVICLVAAGSLKSALSKKRNCN